MADSIEPRYFRLVEAVRYPTKDNWPLRYDQGLRLQRVDQGRRLVAETPVLPELKFMIDLENPTAKEAYTAFVSGRGNLVRFAAAWSDPAWRNPKSSERVVPLKRIWLSDESVSQAEYDAETHEDEDVEDD